jgi:excisionase family DNA binding protein
MKSVKTEYWLSTRKVSERLDVTPRTVARWIRQGEIKAVKMGRVWRVALSEVERFASRGQS